ncbi:hypothetical protein E3A20_29480, partial [Planctomyces bekefii]
HLCVLLHLFDQDYYVDVGYGAPLFEARPLKQSFVLRAPSEVFEYCVESDSQPNSAEPPKSARVVRTPGPTKVLSFALKSLEDVRDAIAFANSWETSRHLKIPTASRFVDGGYLHLVSPKHEEPHGKGSRCSVQQRQQLRETRFPRCML